MQLSTDQTRSNGPAAQKRGVAALRIAIVVTVWLAIVAVTAANASAAGGGVHYWAAADTGGVPPNAPVEPAPADKAKKKTRKRASVPVITGLELSSKTLLDAGRPLTLRYRIKSSQRQVRVRVVVRTRGGAYVRTIQLGVHRTKVLQTTKLTQAELGVSRAGQYKLRLTATDGKGRNAARASGVKSWLAFELADHRFPVVGPFSFGGPDARFGARRPGRTHQGQDVVADEGTPLVAPLAGKVSWVKYEPDGAGYYVVLSSDDGRDYVFMHLKKGSIEVKQGDSVPTGKLLARVGTTGQSSGPHLHFEVWTGGPWQFGGHPVDPLPILKSWYSAAPGGAVQSSVSASVVFRLEHD